VAGPNGTFTVRERGHNGGFMIPVSEVKTEDDVDKILTFLDKMNDEPMSTLWVYGIEGVHYKVENGLAVRIPEALDDYVTRVQRPFRFNFPSLIPEKQARPGDLGPWWDLEVELEEEGMPFIVNNPTEPISSPTHTRLGSQIEVILEDASVLFVTGEIDETEYWARVQQWRDQGGDVIAREFQAAWKANQ